MQLFILPISSIAVNYFEVWSSLKKSTPISTPAKIPGFWSRDCVPTQMSCIEFQKFDIQIFLKEYLFFEMSTILFSIDVKTQINTLKKFKNMIVMAK